MPQCPRSPPRRGHCRAGLSYPELSDARILSAALGNVKAPLGMPKNAATGRVYSGVNVLIVWIACIERGFGTSTAVHRCGVPPRSGLSHGYILRITDLE